MAKPKRDPLKALDGTQTALTQRGSTASRSSRTAGKKSSPEARKRAALKPLRVEDLDDDQRRRFDILVDIHSMEMGGVTAKRIDEYLAVRSPGKRLACHYYKKKWQALSEMARLWVYENAHQNVKMGYLRFSEQLAVASSLSLGVLTQIVAGGGEVKAIDDYTQLKHPILEKKNIEKLNKTHCTIAARRAAAESILKFSHTLRGDAEKSEREVKAKGPKLSEEMTQRVAKAETKDATLKLVKKEESDGSSQGSECVEEG